MAITRSQTASQASATRVARATSTAIVRRQGPARTATPTATTTTNPPRRLPRIILRLGPPPTPAEEALAIARHNRLEGRPYIILRLGPPPTPAEEALAIARHNHREAASHIILRLAPPQPPATQEELRATARPGGRPHITLRMGIRPTAAEELEAVARHDRLVDRVEGRPHAMLHVGRSSRVANGEGGLWCGGGR